MMAGNLRAVAEQGPALIHASNLHLQRNKTFMSFGDQTLEWWSAGAIGGAHLGDRYAFRAQAFGTVGDDVPSPLEPAQLGEIDGIVFLKEAVRLKKPA
ncbi:hypothetical protein ACFQ0B_46375 [Nonomuraea thailandensis]